MAMATELTDAALRAANDDLHVFGEAWKHDLRAERRATMTSVLFDLPRRSALGWELFYRHVPTLLRRVGEETSPEQIGAAMRRLGSRPYALQSFMLMCGYFGARQQHMIDLDLRPGEPLPGGSAADDAFVADWWSRQSRAHRGDGRRVPHEGSGDWPVLDPAQVEEVATLLRPVDAEAHGRTRRTAATLQLYSFILHGEQRDGLGGHGPYPLDQGLLFVSEFNDLRNRWLPWAQTEIRLPLDNLCLVYAAEGVEVHCDVFGSLRVSPPEHTERLRGFCALTNEDGELRRVDSDELAAVEAAAQAAQGELYMKAIEWDDHYKVAYAGPLFANHLAPFLELAGCPDEEIRELFDRFAAEADELAAAMVEEEVPSIWKHLGEAEGPLLYPIAREEED